MLRLLLDENLPVALKPLLLGHDVKTVRDMGWIGIVNGTLLRLAEDAGFQAMVTADKNMAYQNAMAGRRIALVVLSSSQWQTVRDGCPRILAALEALSAGSYTQVALDRPKLRRRPAP